jgi:UDP-N-acetylglucosamine:LPS N-acetylglucosamine transferase
VAVLGSGDAAARCLCRGPGAVRDDDSRAGGTQRRHRFASLVSDCNRNDKWESAICLARIVFILLRFRPHIVISTGALPGFFAIAAGRLLDARTLWIDSIANAEEPSMAGRLARSKATRSFSQWPDLAAQAGGEYHGAVL